MLVLTRKIDEAITVDGHQVRILGIHGGKVRLGIVAPKHVKVLRLEVLKRDQRKDAAA
jgi:carbon storage regulator